MIDKEKGIELRKQGKTYKEIAELLDCSEPWCKVNLRHIIVSKGMTNEQLYEAIKELLFEIEERIKNES